MNTIKLFVGSIFSHPSRETKVYLVGKGHSLKAGGTKFICIQHAYDELTRLGYELV